MTEVSLPVLVSAVLVVAGAIVTGVFGLLNRRTDAKSRATPTVSEVWQRLDAVETRLDAERSARQNIEDMLRTLRNIFVGYVDRVQSGGETELTGDEREALDERRYIETTLTRGEVNQVMKGNHQ